MSALWYIKWSSQRRHGFFISISRKMYPYAMVETWSPTHDRFLSITALSGRVLSRFSMCERSCHSFRHEICWTVHLSWVSFIAEELTWEFWSSNYVTKPGICNLRSADFELQSLDSNVTIDLTIFVGAVLWSRDTEWRFKGSMFLRTSSKKIRSIS